MSDGLLTKYNAPEPAPRRGLGKASLFAVGAVFLFGVYWVSKHQLGADVSGYTLNIESEPAGATLFVNGRLAGATPLAVNGLSLGSYGLRLEKQGCKPFNCSVQVIEHTPILKQKLEALSTGTLQVDIKPDEAEVLLDGELVGYTPLKLGHVAAGSYELLIRKTNFDSYSSRIEVSPEMPLSFSGFELNDKIYAMMNSTLKSEPQRVAHYLDLGHYLFVNDRMDESVEIYTQGMEVMHTALNFDGPGYTGSKIMSDDEKMLEKRLRTEDEARFAKELEKHRGWQHKDGNLFRQKIDEAQEQSTRKNIASWAWAERTGQLHVQNRNYDRAARVYTEHIAAAPAGSKDLPLAYVALIQVLLMQRDLPSATENFDKFFALYKDNGEAMRACGGSLYVYHDHLRKDQDRMKVLQMSERALRRGLELAADPAAKSQCQFDLGTVLIFEERAQDALPLFEQAVAGTQDEATHEARELRLADAMRRSGRLDDSRTLFNKLKTSARANTRENAETGLNFIEADEARKLNSKADK